MKHNLKLTLICLTALMIICIPFTAIAQNLRVSLYESPNNPETPKSGDYLRYEFSVSGGGGNVTGYQVTYTLPDFLGLSHVDGYWGTHNPKTRTITASRIVTAGAPSIGDFRFIATAAGTGEFRIAGTVTTTQGTFNVDYRLPITVTPGLTIISPAQWYLGTQGPYIDIFVYTDHPETPRTGDVLTYSSAAADGLGEDIIAYQVTYTLSDFLGLSHVEGYWGTHNPKTRTITASSVNVGMPGTGTFTVVPTAAGTGDIRITGTVTTTQGTFNVDSQLSVTIAPALTDLAPATRTPKPDPPDSIVQIPDAKLAAAVRKALGLEANASITQQALQKLTTLHVGGLGITNIIGLEYAIHLKQLNLGNNQILDYGPLARLQKLRHLKLWANGISNLSVLPLLPQLEFLDLNWNQISDLSPLAGFTHLKELWLQGNKLANTSTLFQLHNGTFPTDEEVEVIEEQDNLNRTYRLLVFGSLDLKVRINPDAVIFRSANSAVLVAASQRPPMYWIDAKARTLHRLVADEVETLVPTVKNATSLAVDMASGKLYWTEKTGDRTGRIRGANLDGTNVKLVKDLTSVPHSIALDAANGKLYLTNSWGKIQRMDLDGSNFQPNFITDLNAPRNLVLDVTGGKVYWTETAGRSGRIRRANLDGSSVQNVATGLTAPLSLAVANGKVYWTSGRRLYRANLNGINKRALETLPSAPTSIAFDPPRNSFYLTSPAGGIYRRNLDDKVYQPVVTGLVSASNIVLGISATDPVATDTPVPPTEPAGDTAADVNGDKKVNKTDLLLVVTALGESPPANPNFDVNADGTVDMADLLLVVEALDDPIAAAAPTLGETLTALDPAQLAMQIDILRAESDGSMKYAHAIAFFQSLLASIHPTETQLLANYPNPFNPETWIPYQLATDSDVQITIYDGRGVVVRQLVLGHQAPGFYTSRSRAAYWDGRNALGERVASGIYFYQLQTDNVSSLRKMLILK